jgi:hypothetical protein
LRGLSALATIEQRIRVRIVVGTDRQTDVVREKQFCKVGVGLIAGHHLLRDESGSLLLLLPTQRFDRRYIGKVFEHEAGLPTVKTKSIRLLLSD